MEEKDRTNPAPDPAPDPAAQAPSGKKKRRRRWGPGRILFRVILTVVILALVFFVVADVLYNMGYIDPDGALGQFLRRGETAILGEASQALEKWDQFWQSRGKPGLDRAMEWTASLVD